MVLCKSKSSEQKEERVLGIQSSQRGRENGYKEEDQRRSTIKKCRKDTEKIEDDLYVQRSMKNDN